MGKSQKISILASKNCKLFSTGKSVTFILFGVLVLASECSATRCRSYQRLLGECVVITRCPRLLGILLSSDRSVQDLRMLQKLTCVTEISDLDRDPVVCCPLSEIIDPVIPGLNSNSDIPSGNPSSQSPVEVSEPPKVTATSTTTAPQIPPSPAPQVDVDVPINPKFKLFPSLKDCSLSVVSDRIIGGTEVPHGTYPWMARLGYKHKASGRLEYYCGGSIINKRYILTAGHCTQGFDENFLLAEVRLGEHDTTKDVDCNDDLGTQICSAPEDFKIERIITHPRHNTGTKQNDIALIRLSREITFNSYFVRPVCLPFTREYGIQLPDSFSKNTQEVIVAGWGRQQWNKTLGSSTLFEVKIPMVSNAKCQKVYRRRVTITPYQMCAGGVQGKDSCSGDSGGPLMAYVPIPEQLPKPFQFGIVSFGQIQCGGPLPGVYTRVSEYLPWIMDNMEA